MQIKLIITRKVFVISHESICTQLRFERESFCISQMAYCNLISLTDLALELTEMWTAKNVIHIRASSRELGWAGWPGFRDLALPLNPFQIFYVFIWDGGLARFPRSQEILRNHSPVKGQIGPDNRAHGKRPLDQLKPASFFKTSGSLCHPLPLDSAPVSFETNTFICFYFNITP